MDLTSPSTCIHSSHADSVQPNGMCEERGQRECIVVKKVLNKLQISRSGFYLFSLLFGLTLAITTLGNYFLYLENEKRNTQLVGQNSNFNGLNSLENTRVRGPKERPRGAEV